MGVTGEARAAAQAAQRARDMGRTGEALALQRRAVAHAAQAGDPALHAQALRHLADILSDAGELDAALPVYREALAIYADGGFAELDVADAVRGAALAFERLGATEEARDLWSDARLRYAALDGGRGEAGAGRNPGVAEADAHLAMLTLLAG